MAVWASEMITRGGVGFTLVGMAGKSRDSTVILGLWKTFGCFPCQSTVRGKSVGFMVLGAFSGKGSLTLGSKPGFSRPKTVDYFRLSESGVSMSLLRVSGPLRHADTFTEHSTREGVWE